MPTICNIFTPILKSHGINFALNLKLYCSTENFQIWKTGEFTGTWLVQIYSRFTSHILCVICVPPNMEMGKSAPTSALKFISLLWGPSMFLRSTVTHTTSAGTVCVSVWERVRTVKWDSWLIKLWSLLI